MPYDTYDIPDVYSLTINTWNQFGFFSLIFPFLLIFSIIYAIVDFSGIFKTAQDDKIGKKIGVLFSVSFAFIALAHQELIKWLLGFLPPAALVILSFVLALLAISLYSKGPSFPNWLRGLIGLFIILVMLVLAANSINPVEFGGTQSFGSILLLFLNSGLLWVVVFFGVLIAVIMWATK